MSDHPKNDMSQSEKVASASRRWSMTETVMPHQATRVVAFALCLAACCFCVGSLQADWVPDPAAGIVEFAQDVYPVYEGEYSVTVKLIRRNGSLGTVAALFTTEDATATAGEDYQSRGHEVIWDDGDTQPKYVYIPILADTTAEPDEMFRLRLTRAINGVTIGPRDVTSVVISSRDYPRRPSYILRREIHGVYGFVPSLEIDNADSGVSGVGDADGDGLEELLVGSPLLNNGVCAEGSAFLLRELSNGFYGAVDPVTTTAKVQFAGTIALGAAGRTVRGVGDVNGDGYSDFVVLTQQPPGQRILKGEAYLVYGRKDLPSYVDLGFFDNYRAGRRIYSSENDFEPVDAAAAGDFNGDGCDDILIAFKGYFNDRKTCLILGSSTADCTGLDVNGLGLSTGYLFAGARLGTGLGDMNGDGYSDLSIGYTPSSVTYNRIVYGTSSQLPVLSGAVVDLTQLGAPSVIAGDILRPAGDVNGDGYQDVVCVADSPLGSCNGPLVETTTTVCLLFGYSPGISGELILPDDMAYVGGVTVTVPGGALMAKGIGDANGDGYGDLAVSCPFSCPGWQPKGENVLYLVYGSATGVGLTRQPDSNGVFCAVPVDGENVSALYSDEGAGHAATDFSSAGDANLDGLDDLIVGNGYFDDSSIDVCSQSPRRADLIYSVGSMSEATYRLRLHSGAVSRRGVGLVCDGSRSVPASRCWVAYSAGSASMESVTIKSGLSGLSGLPNRVAPVQWHVQSNRTGYSSAQYTFKYLLSETASLDLSQLHMMTSTSASGPWEIVTEASHDPERREITVSVAPASSRYFVLSDSPVLFEEGMVCAWPCRGSNVVDVNARSGCADKSVRGGVVHTQLLPGTSPAHGYFSVTRWLGNGMPLGKCKPLGLLCKTQAQVPFSLRTVAAVSATLSAASDPFAVPNSECASFLAGNVTDNWHQLGTSDLSLPAVVCVTGPTAWSVSSTIPSTISLAVGPSATVLRSGNGFSDAVRLCIESAVPANAGYQHWLMSDSLTLSTAWDGRLDVYLPREREDQLPQIDTTKQCLYLTTGAPIRVNLYVFTEDRLYDNPQAPSSYSPYPNAPFVFDYETFVSGTAPGIPLCVHTPLEHED